MLWLSLFRRCVFTFCLLLFLFNNRVDICIIYLYLAFMLVLVIRQYNLRQWWNFIYTFILVITPLNNMMLFALFLIVNSFVRLLFITATALFTIFWHSSYFMLLCCIHFNELLQNVDRWLNHCRGDIFLHHNNPWLNEMNILVNDVTWVVCLHYMLPFSTHSSTMYIILVVSMNVITTANIITIIMTMYKFNG